LITPEIDAEASAAQHDDPAEDIETGPMRRCIVTRESLPRERMLRFVLGPDNILVPDLSAKLPGRGMWLSARADVLEIARTKGAFSKAARLRVALPTDLPSRLQSGLSRRIGDLLGLTRRAGQAVCGFQKVREWLQAGRAGLVVQASDGSGEERARLLSGYAHMPSLAPLTGAALGAVFGREHVVHVAVAPGRLATTIEIETERLNGLLAVPALQQRAGK
jgi:predicted RNA-binding protein YlxR (DUF448 family)/ribosomal protein L30E